jgi:cytochrome c
MRILLGATVGGLCLLLALAFKQAPKPRVLIFSRTLGWRHSCIPFAISAIQKLGSEHGFDTDTTTNAALFTDDNLKKYSAVIFNSTSGNVLNNIQQTAFERYIQSGGGFVGIHGAAITEYDWPWYGQLMGAFFAHHPNNPNVRKGAIDIVNKNHPATKDLPERWERYDEWYNFASFYPGIKVLANLDENSYDGGTNGSSHPITWYHEYDGGRAFYTGTGHTDESYTDPVFLKQLLGGIQYAIGGGIALDYSKAYAKVVPEQNRFVKTILKENLASPMELAIAPDGRIVYTELLGNISVYDPRSGKNKLAARLPVTNIGGTGLIGVVLDPHFDVNQLVYLYYAPAGQSEEPLNFQLSRFVLSKNNMLDIASEKVLLRVPVQKSSGSHHGGSLAFDKDGNLYLSTGDSSVPFPSEGYAPLDERPDKELYSQDSQRGAGNSNDFKGKILRIHPEANGGYTIPKGNLFAEGTAKTKPEIYVMGVRNPYRIALNPKTSVLYWGDIGPDAGTDGIRGPRGYDELNQAKQAGNYGWPYFAGNNFAYAHWDFATKTAGPRFDPGDPVNNSPNNTGLKHLPPAQPAMIWYPYAASAQFPELGSGARCIIGGAFYSYDPNTVSPNKFPEYYDGTLFMADWMRNWVFAVRFDKEENFLRNEAFMASNGDFRRPIDMTFGKDGVMYMLEYGSVYGMANADARLVKIEYNTGNRKPVAKASIVDTAEMAAIDKRVFLTAEKKVFEIHKAAAGAVPLRLKFSSQGSMDPDDDDQLKYEWWFEGKPMPAANKDITYVFTRPGTYKVILRITDNHGAVSRDTVLVKAGNAPPQVRILSKVNTSFFWKDQPFYWYIDTKDAEDKTTNAKQIDAFYVYRPGAVYPGQALLASSDCKACHQVNAAAVGPSFMAIAARYKTREGAIDQLAKKIIQGGGGNWGKVHNMSAHPQISESDAKEIVKYIFSLTDKAKPTAKTTLAKMGGLKLEFYPDEPKGRYEITAAYTDNGHKNMAPMRSTDRIEVRYATQQAVFADEHPGFPRFRNSLSEGGNKAYLLFKDIDLNNISKFRYNYAAKDKDGEILVRMDSQIGPVISRIRFTPTGSFDKFSDLDAPLLRKISGKHHLYFVVVRTKQPDDALVKINTITFDR